MITIVLDQSLKPGDKVKYKTESYGILKGKVLQADRVATNTHAIVWKITSKLPKGHMYKRGQVMSTQASSPLLYRRSKPRKREARHDGQSDLPKVHSNRN